MFNWYGKHKIGILGAANSGKTIFLTSLLWHLSAHDPKRFEIGKKGGMDAEIRDFRIVPNKRHNFNFEKNKNTFIKEHRWPAKTTDFSIATCKYSRSDRICEREISFVDIPGERMSDILMWQASSYAEWVERLEMFWDNNPAISKIMAHYKDLSHNPATSLAELNREYKDALWKMLACFCPVTPSTYFLGQDGQMLGDENNSDVLKAIEERPIWDGGELLPVSPEWGYRQHREYAQFETNFMRYKKEVLKPLFDEICDCDNFVFCVDIQNILMSGPELLMQVKDEIHNFRDVLAPSKFFRFLNKIGNNPPRLAWVATKSDMILPEDKDKLDCLLSDLSHTLMPGGIKYKRFICSACVSTEIKQDERNQIWITGTEKTAHGSEEIYFHPLLPESWPDQWDGKNYLFPEIIPKISSVRPPEQHNLNRIFEFVVEDHTFGE